MYQPRRVRMYSEVQEVQASQRGAHGLQQLRASSSGARNKVMDIHSNVFEKIKVRAGRSGQDDLACSPMIMTIVLPKNAAAQVAVCRMLIA